jgi:hypothetical protein
MRVSEKGFETGLKPDILLFQRIPIGIPYGFSLLRKICALFGLWVGLMTWMPPAAWAIVQHPSQSEILQAIKRGQIGAQSRTLPNHLYWRFGSSDEDLQPFGYLMTKLNGIAVMSAHFALRGEEPAKQDIQRILDEKALQVVVNIFGDSPVFAMNSYLILQQGNQLVKPDRIRFDARASSTGQKHGASVYRAKVVASFIFGTFDLRAPTTIKVFPGTGGEVIFELDFSAIP